MISIRIDISPDGKQCWVYDDKSKLLYPHFTRFVSETTTQFMQRVMEVIIKEIVVEDW